MWVPAPRPVVEPAVAGVDPSELSSPAAFDRLAAPPEARVGGHGTSEYWLLRDFIAAVRGAGPAPIDVHRALDYTLPGICARQSAARGGAPVAVPDPRQWAS